MYQACSLESAPQRKENRAKILIAVCTTFVGVSALIAFSKASATQHYAVTSQSNTRVVAAAPRNFALARPSQLTTLQAARPEVSEHLNQIPSKIGEASSNLLAAAMAPLLATIGGLAYLFGRSQQPQLAMAGPGGFQVPSDLTPTFFRMSADESGSGAAVASGPSGGGAPQKDSDIDLDTFTPSELETMYIDALWAYYTEGKAILTDEQFSQLKMELNWQGSGFPTLHREEIEFVKAVLAFAKGEPILNNEEYDKLKERVKASGKRKDVTAFLIMVKGKQLLPPEKFRELQSSMKAAGVKASPESIRSTLSDTPNTLQYQVQEVLYMYSALGLVPSAICASAWGFLGFIMGGLGGVKAMATLGFPVIGASSFLLTREIIRYLDLTGPKIVKGVCPCCEAPIEASFFDCTPAQKVEKCSNCGTLTNLDSQKMLIKDAAGFSFIGDGADDKKTVDQYLSWASGVASGILVGKSPVSQLGGRKSEGDKAKPTSIPEVISQEITTGIFAWAVLLGYGLFGETFVARARGKGIAIHSGAINDFCKRFNIPNGLRQKYIQTAKRNGHDLGFLVDANGLIGDGLFGKQAMEWWKASGF